MRRSESFVNNQKNDNIGLLLSFTPLNGAAMDDNNELFSDMFDELDELMERAKLPFVWYRKKRMWMITKWMQRFDLAPGQLINDQQFLEIRDYLLRTYVEPQITDRPQLH
jgi:hypothetical protein